MSAGTATRSPSLPSRPIPPASTFPAFSMSVGGAMLQDPPQGDAV